jgi:hypothetical protein
MATIFKNWDELGEALSFDEKGRGKLKETEKVVVDAPEKGGDDEAFVKKNIAKEKIKKLIRGASDLMDDGIEDADDILDELEGKLGDDEEEVEEEKPNKWTKRAIDLEKQGEKGGKPRGFVVNTVTTIVKPKHGKGFRDRDEEEPDDHAIRDAEEEKDMPKDPMERENLRNEIRGLEQLLRSRNS